MKILIAILLILIATVSSAIDKKKNINVVAQTIGYKKPLYADEKLKNNPEGWVSVSFYLIESPDRYYGVYLAIYTKDVNILNKYKDVLTSKNKKIKFTIPKKFLTDKSNTIDILELTKYGEVKPLYLKNLKKKTKAIQSKKSYQTGVINHKGFEYKTVKSPHTNKIWLDRNLGASRVAISKDDSKSFGDYYQWGRYTDGHEKMDSETTKTISKNHIPNHSKFINNDIKRIWDNSRNNNLWQGVNGINNPCPKGFRVPTIYELADETYKQNVKNKNDVFNSFLKIPSSGLRYLASGSVGGQGDFAKLWTSSKTKYKYTISTNFSHMAHESYSASAYGLCVRCIKD